MGVQCLHQWHIPALWVNLQRPVWPGRFKALHGLHPVHSIHSTTIPSTLQSTGMFSCCTSFQLRYCCHTAGGVAAAPGVLSAGSAACAPAGHAQSCLHVPRGFLCWFWMKPVMVCRGCICSDFRLHESSHTVFKLCVPAMFVQHCSWAAICDRNCLLRLVNLEAVQSGKTPGSHGEYCYSGSRMIQKGVQRQTLRR